VNELGVRQEFTLLVAMLADWHVGSGAGRIGSVDRRAVRDQDGLPYLPAKTLTGIWRDACEQVAWALDDGADSGWSRLLAVVFGDQPPVPETFGDSRRGGPRPALLSVRPAHLSPALRAALRADSRRDDELRFQLRDALTFIEPGVRVDARSGRAMDDHLRFTEVARGGCILQAEGCRLDLSGLRDVELRRDAWALLIAGMRMVDRLGGDRRRGSGRCRWSLAGLTEVDELAAVEWLRVRPKPPEPDDEEPDEPTVRPALPRAGVEATDGWWELRLRIRLLDPVVVADRVIGNVTTCLDHVPGRLLLPLVERALVGAGFDTSDAIVRGDVRVLPAYLEVEGERGRPVPLSLGRSKGAGDHGTFQRLDGQSGQKQVRSGYVGVLGPDGEVAFDTVDTTLQVHNTVHDEDQRPQGGGGVFSHEAVKAGTLLRSAVRVRATLAQSMGDWWRRLEGEHRLGRSKKDDYGRVEIEALGEPGPVGATYPERAGELWVWCQSDLLLDDGAGDAPPTSPQALVDALGGALGLPEGALELHPDGPCHLRVRRQDAWQTRWGMPRPSLVAIAAGSAVRLRLQRPVQTERAEAVLREGIGLRRAEGFGDMAFNDPLLDLDSLPYRPPIRSRTDGVGSREGDDLRGTDLRFAETVEREAWRSLIRSVAVERGANRAFRTETLRWPERLPASQLGTLRMIARSPQRVERLARLAKVLRRADKWGTPALEVLSRLFRQPTEGREAEVWNLLDAAQWPELTSGGRRRLRARLWEEAVIVLVDEAARRHAVESGDEA
jgi:CRISPR-associated protein Csx10